MKTFTQFLTEEIDDETMKRHGWEKIYDGYIGKDMTHRTSAFHGPISKHGFEYAATMQQKGPAYDGDTVRDNIIKTHMYRHPNHVPITVERINHPIGGRIETWQHGKEGSDTVEDLNRHLKSIGSGPKGKIQ